MIGHRRPPPDDDPLFAAWVRDIGPLREMPDPMPQARPTVAAVVLGAAILGAAVVMGIAWALAFNAISVGIALTLALLGFGVSGAALAWLVRQAT